MNARAAAPTRLLATLAVPLALFLAPVAARADFGLAGPDVTFTKDGGSPDMGAGTHPFAFTATVAVNTKPAAGGEVLPDEEAKDVTIDFPPGLVGTPNPVPPCSSADFVLIDGAHPYSACPASSAIGVSEVAAAFGPVPSLEQQFKLNVANGTSPVPVFNLVAPPGVASKLGFVVVGSPVTVETSVSPEPPYHLVTHVTNIPDFVQFYGSRVTLWGVPADPVHDSERGECAILSSSCPVSLQEVPFLTLPTACAGPLHTAFAADSWQHPGEWTDPFVAETHNSAIPSSPLGLGGCSKLPFKPTITAKPTTLAAQSPTGLDFSLDVKDEGLTSPTGTAQSEIKKAVVTLPEGFSTNPSIAEGLNVCSEADLARETAASAPGAGCPNAAKIGTVEVETPLLDENVNGSLFIAKPYENPFGSLLALYIVIKNPKLGIVIRQPLEVRPDPVTGRLTTIADDLPQLPFSHFKLHFREGARSPLASPPSCGVFNAEATLTPWSGGAAITTSSAFQIITGPGGGACPSGGEQPFHPGFEAGTLNNAAGHYSPFYLHLSRNDGEQEFTRFSIKLPPGLIGKLAGIPYCPDANIEAAKSRTGTEEDRSPSCPAASEVGHTLVGAGVGPSLAYAPGKVYLAGSYHGSALSIVAITAARVGPFDLGTVVVRQALKINPDTAEVFIDAAGSDPIPHIIDGIPVHARDIRAYVDKPDFVLNPTSCKRTSTASTIMGSGLDFGAAADDSPFTVTSPFQAADCASLGFAPKLALSLRGGARRGAHPRFKAVLTYPRGSYANIARSQVTLPHSEFLEQGHIRTICTRVQFAEGNVPGERCPPGSIYGHAKAITPILSDPIEGPVFLRSSSNKLPDLVVALHNGQINVNLVGRIDSVKGGIRNTFETVPDAPVTKFTLEMRGGEKGLLVNSTNLCGKSSRALADFTGQNGKRHVFNPVLKPECDKRAKKHKG